MTEMQKTQVLDHGYVQLVESWGSDERIVEAARMSTNKGFLGWGDPEKPGDEKLLRYLYEHKHATPFEMAGMVIEVRAPIMVFREWHRHRTQSYNEQSARYVKLECLDYVPTFDRLLSGANTPTKNKQAQGSGKTLTREDAQLFIDKLIEHYENAESLYQFGIDIGVPKELARLPMTVGRYSKMRASANLRNWLGFLSLRMPGDAQEEIRVYAEAVGELIKDNFPRTWELFSD